MKILRIGKREIRLLTQTEKAQELGLNRKSMYLRTAEGKADNIIVRLPNSTRLWYLAEGETL